LPGRAQQKTPVAERRDANLFEVLICQIRQDDKTNVILGKTPSVLAETEPLEPVCNLLHRGCTPEIFSSMVRSRTGAAKQ
jgi:kynureninase